MQRQAGGDDLPYAPRGPEDSIPEASSARGSSEEILELGDALRTPLVLHDIEGLPTRRSRAFWEWRRAR